VNQIRSALRDAAEVSQYIRTLPRHGYRFVASITRTVPAKFPAPFMAPTSAHLPGPQAASAADSVSRQSAEEAAGPSIDAAPRRGKFAIAALMLIALMAIPLDQPRLGSQRAAPLSSKDSVVVADFVNATGDTVFDDTLNQALMIELRQSPFLNVLPDTTVRETLRMMGLSVSHRLTPEVARELCQRSGSAAELEGRISSIGDHYLVSVNAIACASGETLAGEHEEAARKENVLAALGHAASRLRTALGESLPSVRKFEAPARVTTASLDALKSYSVGLRVASTQGDAPSIPFFKHALELDPQFALANAALGSRYSNLDQPSLALEYAIKAYQLRDGVTERERLVIVALYFRVNGELEQSTQTLEMWKAEYPRDSRPHGSLGVNYYYRGQYEKSAAEWEEVLRLVPDDVSAYENLSIVYLALNRVDAAQSLIRSGMARHLDSGELRRIRYLVEFLRGNPGEMDQQLESTMGKPGAEDLLLAAQSDTDSFFGRLSSSRRFLQRAVDSATRSDLREEAALWQVVGSLTEAEFGNRSVAIGEVRVALSLAAGRNVKILGALALARAGDSVNAEAIAAELEADNSKNTVWMLYRLPSIKAAIALSRGNPRRALEILEPARPYELGIPTPSGLAPLYPPYLRGQAYLLLRDGGAAALEFQKILDHPGIAPNLPLRALAQLQLARAAVVAKDVAAARSAYRDFLALWKDADSNVPVFIAARSELARLH
jgi:eukaryotic-like serine/threonine-protein kinase